MSDDGRASARRPRVCSVPAGHAYVRHLDDPATPLVLHLPDPAVPGAPPGRWWPHASLEPAWVRENADAFDVLHVHFGFEHRTPEQLAALVEALAEVRRPLVLTVHDLDNPHLLDQDAHAARLQVLVQAAHQVLTLTPGAAHEVRRRWGRTAIVVPHPHVTPLDALDDPRPVRTGPPRVGLHLKDVRANIDLRVLDPLRDSVPGVRGARLQVSVHRSGLHRLPAPVLDRLEASDHVDLLVHEPWDDDELADALRRLDALVLPYAHGTHSGMVELCHDLGTAVVASDAGLWHEQHQVSTYATGSLGPDPASLAVALDDALTREVVPACRQERLLQRRHLARVHRAVYDRATAAAEVAA